MKRIISFTLTICLLLTVFSTLFLVGCGKNKVKGGTEAAKLLLANERLDETLVGQKIDVGVTSEETDSVTVLSNSYSNFDGATASAQMPSVQLLKNSYSPSKNIVSLSRESNQSYTWDDFPATSESLYEYKAFILTVEEEATRVAGDIAEMKSNVGVVDKWVNTGYGKQMLRVYDNRDVLIVFGEYEDIHVYYRYTDENAKNVYEMYSLMKYDNGTTGDIRTLFIPGERVEYMYNNSDGFTDYFIAENTRGYWMSTRFSYFYDEENDYKCASFFPYIVKDGIGSGALLELRTEPIYGENGQIIGDRSNQLKNTWYTIFSPKDNREIFKIIDEYSSTSFWLYFSAITDGFVSVSSDTAHFYDGAYTCGELDEIKTSNGTYKIGVGGDKINGFELSNGFTHYDYGAHKYSGVLSISDASEESLINKTANLMDALSQMGLTLACDFDTIASSLDHSVLLSNEFGETFEWYGYKMNSLANVESARKVLQDDYDKARNEYEAVKDFETISKKQKLDDNIKFAAIEALTTSNNTYTNGIISIDNISAVISDTTLFESGKDYTLKVALSLCDENGNPISVNTVSLKLDGEESVFSFSNDAITLTANGKYTVPKNLSEGNYALVCYAATADEGIRVTELTKIGSFSTADKKLESSAMDINVKIDNTNLHFEYLIKNSISIEATSENGALSYEDATRIVMLEILSKGAPKRGEMLEKADGTEIPEGTSLGVGEYRIKCYLATSDGLAESYINLTIK